MSVREFAWNWEMGRVVIGYPQRGEESMITRFTAEFHGDLPEGHQWGSTNRIAYLTLFR